MADRHRAKGDQFGSGFVALNPMARSLRCSTAQHPASPRPCSKRRDPALSRREVRRLPSDRTRARPAPRPCRADVADGSPRSSAAAFGHFYASRRQDLICHRPLRDGGQAHMTSSTVPRQANYMAGADYSIADMAILAVVARGDAWPVLWRLPRPSSASSIIITSRRGRPARREARCPSRAAGHRKPDDAIPIHSRTPRRRPISISSRRSRRGPQAAPSRPPSQVLASERLAKQASAG